MCKKCKPPFSFKIQKKKRIRKDLGEGNHKKQPAWTDGGRARRGPGRHAGYEAGGAATAPHRSRCPAGRSVGPRPCARKVNGRMEPENGRRQRRRLASRHARHVRPRARSIGRWSPPCTHGARYSGSRILGTGAGTLAWPGLAARAVPSRTCPAVVRTARARAVSLRGPAHGQALRRGRGAPTALPGYPPSRVRLCIGRSPTQGRNAAPRPDVLPTRNRCPQASPTRGPAWDRVPCVRACEWAAAAIAGCARRGRAWTDQRRAYVRGGCVRARGFWVWRCGTADADGARRVACCGYLRMRGRWGCAAASAGGYRCAREDLVRATAAWRPARQVQTARAQWCGAALRRRRRSGARSRRVDALSVPP